MLTHMKSESNERLPAPSLDRKIIHCDCDCFYAAIEMRDNPTLINLPIAVGGAAQTRGVIATANYLARARGVHSAMSTARALQLCPELVVVKPRFEQYRAASKAILSIYHDYTDRVEPLSLDEAYLDVTGAHACRGSATLMAAEIRSRISRDVGITASAGIASNKFLAKIASDWNKPNGQFVILPSEKDAFVAQLPVEKIWGVGQVTAARLHKLGVLTCADLRHWTPMQLLTQFGRFGQTLYHLCRGEDSRPVLTERIRKSLSVETTFPQDLISLSDCLEALPALEAELAKRHARLEAPAPIQKQFIKLRFRDFTHTTTECLSTHLDSARWQSLLATAYARQSQPVRLLGVGVRFTADSVLESAQPQLALGDLEK